MTLPPKKILIIEDDPNTAQLVALYLEKEGFSSQRAHDGEMGLNLARKQMPDLVILDLMLPRMDGWEVCRRLRQISEVPVIMLTARGEEIDRVAGLTLGADDFVVKPFSPRELVARVKAILRRTAPLAARPTGPRRLGDVEFDPDKRRVCIKGCLVALTPHEYCLLETLTGAPGRTFTREELLARLYPSGAAVVIDRVVDVHIGKLRQKIETLPDRPRHILTVRGIGYRFAEPPELDKQS